MREPTLRTSRRAIAGGLVAAIALIGAGFVLGRLSSPRPAPTPIARPAPSAPVRSEAQAPRILGRADIIALGDRAAAAFAAGTPLPADIAAMAGQRFDLALPFGCDGPTPEDSVEPMRWRYDAESQTLRIRVAPAQWSLAEWGLANPAAKQVMGAEAETGLEGFWVARPWSIDERCPAMGNDEGTPADPAIPPTGPTLAVARPITDDQRGDRPYQLVQRLAPDHMDGGAGFRLRVSGRIERLADHGPVRCVQPGGIDQRPRCLIGISFDRVRIENALDDAILATWSAPPASRETAP